MASFTEKISITESDETYSIKNSYGTHSNMSNGKAVDDQQTWGTALNENNNRQSLEFSKKYLNFTFELRRDTINQSSSIKSGAVILYGIQDGKEISISRNFGGNSGNTMYTSQSDELLNIVSSDKNMLIRVQIPTSTIYNIGKIQRIYCEIWDRDDKKIYKEWNLLNNTTSYKYHKWKKEGLGKDVIERGSTYTYKYISPKLYYEGSINIYSKILNYDTETNCGKQYFTGSNGEIKVDVKNVVFFNDAGIRVPSHLFFEGEGAELTEVSLKKGKDDGLQDNSTSDSFDSSKIKKFTRINKVYACFGGDKDNKMLVKTFDNGFLNADVENNVSIKFSQNKNSGVNNIIMGATENGQQQQLKVELEGNITLDSSYPFEFRTDLNPYLTYSSGVHSEKQESVPIANFVTRTATTLTINYNWIYEFSETLKSDNYSINILEKCPLKEGKYNLSCNIINKLKVKTSDGKEDDYKFKFVNNYEVTIKSNEGYLVFGGVAPIIEYSNITVDGKIIIKNEELKFQGINANNFRIYKINPKNSSEQVPDNTITRNKYYIGLHKDHHYGWDSAVDISPQEITTNTEIALTYDKLNKWLSYTNKDEQKTFYITYILNTNKGELQVPPFKYILGRVVNPLYDGLRVEDKAINYFLMDNGCDRTYGQNGVGGLSQNDFINKRLINEEDFSISRNAEEDYAKEMIYLTFIRNKSTIIEIPIKIANLKSSTAKALEPQVMYLDQALELLKTGKINEFSFENILSGLDNNTASLIENGGSFDLEITIKYIYKENSAAEGQASNEVSQNLITILLTGINFSPDVIPIGLRNGGVIINPKDNGNEQLNIKDSNNKKNTFVINVNQVQKTGSSSYEEINGLKITFNVPNTDQTSGEITLEETATFEIYLDEKGIVHLSNCVIDPAPTAET